MGVKCFLMKGVLCFILSVVYSQLLYSQSNLDERLRSQVGVSSAYMLTGELNSVYDFTGGIDGKYYVFKRSKFNPFVGADFVTSLGSQGVRLTAYEVNIGGQYDFLKVWKRSLYVEAEFGGLLLVETFKVQLIEAAISHTFSEFGFSVGVGLGYRVSKHIDAQINVQQYNTNGTSVGVGISYLF